MGFPFSIKYTKHLKHKLSVSDTNKALNCIADIVTKKTGEDISIQDNQLTFKSGFFTMRWNTNIMVSIEKGEFNIINDDIESILTYEIFMYRFFITVVVMCIIIGIVSQQIWVGALFFLWLGGMNCVIAINRHRNFLNDIAGEIDLLSEEKTTSAAAIVSTETLNKTNYNKIPSQSQPILFYFILICWIASLLTNILAITDFDVSQKFPFIWFLHVGIFLTVISAIFVLRKSTRLQDPQIRNNPLKVFRTLLKGTPYWLIMIEIVGVIYAVINFSLFAASQNGVPDIQNGHYVLHEHGQIIRTLTKKEYQYYQANEVRGFSGHWIAFYGIGLVLLYPYGKQHNNQ